ncbi:MAG: ribosome-recycling factor [Candidatus Dojkabacteria bacterium]
MLFNESAYTKELDQVIESFTQKLKELRTGKAGMEVFDTIQIDQYGTMSPLSYAATISFPTPIQANIKPFNKTDISQIGNAIRNANIGGSVSEQSEMVIVNFMPLTQEDRAETAKQLNKMLEDFRIRSRGIRQNYKQKLDALEGVSEDEQRVSEKRIQELLDKNVEQLESLAEAKGKDINPNAK